jgi:hypothetical protein
MPFCGLEKYNEVKWYTLPCGTRTVNMVVLSVVAIVASPRWLDVNCTMLFPVAISSLVFQRETANYRYPLRVFKAFGGMAQGSIYHGFA